jgi:hypothetical protein
MYLHILYVHVQFFEKLTFFMGYTKEIKKCFMKNAYFGTVFFFLRRLHKKTLFETTSPAHVRCKDIHAIYFSFLKLNI